MKFTARVSSRSSVRSSGPPGEAEILKLNPQRREMILKATGWKDLFAGTLNLEVGSAVVTELCARKPLIREPGETVKYPNPYKHIPRRRIAYLYYLAVIQHSGKSSEVLIRTAVDPLPGRIEAFAAERLRDVLAVSDRDVVECEIIGSSEVVELQA